MAFRASAVNKGAIVAAICVALVVCWVAEPAEGSPSSATDGCISECPSMCNEKAASSCEGAKSFDVARCRPGCIKGCTDSCHSAGEATCDCDSECEDYCKSTPSHPNYDGCVAQVFNSCKDSCEKSE